MSYLREGGSRGGGWMGGLRCWEVEGWGRGWGRGWGVKEKRGGRDEVSGGIRFNSEVEKWCGIVVKKT